MELQLVQIEQECLGGPQSVNGHTRTDAQHNQVVLQQLQRNGESLLRLVVIGGR